MKWHESIIIIAVVVIAVFLTVVVVAVSSEVAMMDSGEVSNREDEGRDCRWQHYSHLLFFTFTLQQHGHRNETAGNVVETSVVLTNQVSVWCGPIEWLTMIHVTSYYCSKKCLHKIHESLFATCLSSRAGSWQPMPEKRKDSCLGKYGCGRYYGQRIQNREVICRVVPFCVGWSLGY